MRRKQIGLYIHIPFCKQKCSYCDFCSYAEKQDLISKYIKCLLQEIKEVGSNNRADFENGKDDLFSVKTIYIGGGTPSLIESKYIVQTIEEIKSNFELDENTEITIEVNPGTVTLEKLEDYNKVGINRLSIGLQSTHEHLLKEIGRIHTYLDFLDTFRFAREAGFENINVDLMIGLPNQTLDDVKESTKKVMALKPEHISVYSLILEENTKLEDFVIKGKMELPDDEIERKMYWYVKKALEKHKYIHYEISNFAKPGFESKHNSDCWNQNEYIGIGAAASSFMNNARYENTSDLEEYISNIENEKPSKNIQLQELLNDESKIDEYMMLSLRKISGVNITEFKRKFNQNPIIRYNKILEKLIKEELIEIDGNNIRLSSKGIDLANLVWEEFI